MPSYRYRRAKRGDDISWLLIVEETDPETLVVSRKNLTGATITMYAKRKITDADGSAVINVSTTSGHIVPSPQSGDTLGEATVHVPGTQTGGLEDTLVWLLYEVQMVTVGVVRKTTIEEGQILIVPDVVKA